ncbi:hypothetical protein [Streptomyces sp. NPDC050504]|uniref:hypothetical protein n=1 Tax=Streptomyces sp. NPDC050504 TaxID=3365618 RepID=UPI0037A41CA3
MAYQAVVRGLASGRDETGADLLVPDSDKRERLAVHGPLPQQCSTQVRETTRRGRSEETKRWTYE